MATLDRPDDDNTPKYTMDYYPEDANKLKFEYQMQLRVQSESLKKASREQLYQIAMDALCLNYRTREAVAAMAKKEGI